MAILKFPPNDEFMSFCRTEGFPNNYNDCLKATLQNDLGSSTPSIGDLMRAHFDRFQDEDYFSITNEAFRIIKSYGTDAHVYLPGIGVINGLTAGNYLDSAGTTVATVDNPVGLVLDAANSQLGSELAVNGSFSTDTDWTKGAGWTISGGSANFSNPTGTSLTQTIPAIASGKLVKLEFYLTFTSGGGLTVGLNVGGGIDTFGTFNSTGLKTAYVTTTVARSGLSITGIGGSVLSIDNISVKEVTGIHAIQATTANKPILRRGAVNLLTYSEQFDNAAWGKLRTDVTANQVNSPIGTLTADLLSTPVATTAGEQAARVSATVLANTTFSIYVKKYNWRYAHIRLINYSIFDFDTEGFTLTGAGEVVSFTKLSDGWYRLSTTNATGGSANYGVGLAGASTVAAWATPVAGTAVYAWGAQLETGSTASTYVPTTTAAASSPSGNYHWVHDSTDVLTATFPAGYESATTINASTAGQSTLTAQNIVGAYNIGPSIDTYGRFVFRTGLTASELTIMQSFANRLAGV